MPWGIVAAERGQRSLRVGSAYHTSAWMGDALAAWGPTWEAPEHKATKSIPSTRDHGPASRGRRTPWLHRLGPVVDASGTPVPWRYSPPSHSTDNPSERCWGILARHGNGTPRIEVATRCAWAKRRTWQGLQPMVALRHAVSQKGLSLGTKAMQAVAAR
jgi:hypothetical protein